MGYVGEVLTTNDDILVISTKINVNLNGNRVVLCQKTIAIAINRPQMSVCMNMMCYEHLTGPISHLLSADIRFWSKQINTRRDNFKGVFASPTGTMSSQDRKYFFVFFSQV